MKLKGIDMFIIKNVEVLGWVRTLACISGISKAGPGRAGALPNIQSAHPTPLAKNLGKEGLIKQFFLLQPLRKHLD